MTQYNNSTDFWYWFLAPNEIGLDTKVAIMAKFADKKAEDIQSYVKDELGFDDDDWVVVIEEE